MDPCKKFFEEMKEAMEEWLYWEKRSRLPVSTAPIDEPRKRVVLTPELFEQIKDAREKEAEAKHTYEKAVSKYLDCKKRNNA